MREFLSRWFDLVLRVRNWHEIKAHVQLAALFDRSFGERMSERSKRTYWRPLAHMIGFKAKELMKNALEGDSYADED